MFQKILNFIKYNNAFTVGLMMLFLGAGMSFAASPDLRNGVYSSTQTVTSVDNSAIISADLNNFNFDLKITGVTEDANNYYVNYTYQTLDIEDNIWQNVSESQTLTVNKESLGDEDLGLYVAKQLGDNINYQLSYLEKVQDLQKAKGLSQKVVTTEYLGLIGKLLDPKQEVIEGYNPVIPEVASPIAANTVNPTPAVVNTNTPQSSTPDQTLSPDQIKEIVESLLAQNQAQTPATTPPATTPDVTPTPDTTTPTPTSDTSTTTPDNTSSTTTDSTSTSPTPATDTTVTTPDTSTTTSDNTSSTTTDSTSTTTSPATPATTPTPTSDTPTPTSDTSTTTPDSTTTTPDTTPTPAPATTQ